MRQFVAGIILCAGSVWAQTDSGFSGTWKLNAAKSEVNGLPSPPDPVLNVEQDTLALTVAGKPASKVSYPLNGQPVRSQTADATIRTTTKWEGSALLVNRVVSGPQNYTIMERWRRSRDGSTLTIRRTIVRLSGESESVLVYENANSMAIAAVEPRSEPKGEAGKNPDETVARVTPRPSLKERPTAPKDKEFVIDAGTRILLRLSSSVNTKGTRAGDRIYLETAVPISVDDREVIPRGSYVTGTVIEAEKAGRGSDKASLNVHFDSLSLPNGVTRDFRARTGSVDTVGNVDRAEGRIEGESNKGKNAGKIGQDTVTGARIGTLGGVMGAGIGAAAGATAGLAGVLFGKGKEVVLPPGTTMEMVLDRDLHYTASELLTGR